MPLEWFDRLPSLKPADFARVKSIMREQFGIELREGKQQLVAARLANLLREKRVGSFRDYLDQLEADRSGKSLIRLADALTTNHTSFFRESAHFDFLRQWLVQEGGKRATIRIWSAGCATGEEPFSIVCCAIEALGEHAVRDKVEVLATDLSARALHTAQLSVYAEPRFAGLELAWRRRFLLRGSGHWDGHYQFKKHVRSAVRFGRLNLIDPVPAVGSFSFIFCRNVMIYFDNETRGRVVNRLSDCLDPDGYLLVGHSEGLFGFSHSLRTVHPAVYRRVKEGHL